MAKVLEFQLQHQSFQWISGLISFRMDWLDLFAVQGTFKSLLQHHSSKSSIRWGSAFFIVQLSHPYVWDFPGKSTGMGCHFLLQWIFPTRGLNPGLLHCRQTLNHLSHQGSYPYMTTEKSIALTRWTLVGKVISLRFNMLSRLVITFLPKSKSLLTLWLQSPFTVILEPKKMKSITVSTFSPSICHEMMGLDAMTFILCSWVLSHLFRSPLSPRGSVVPLHFLPLKWRHLHIWGGWYFSWQFWFQFLSHPTWQFTWCTLQIS